MIIGITGSIGSGKTTAANLFAKHGFEVINVDKIYHKLSKPDKLIYKKITAEFGNQILNKDKSINRDKLKKIVFNNSSKLKKLNSITHPLIVAEIKKLIKKIKRKNNNVEIIIDAPLLIEANANDLADKIIVVKCDGKIQVLRLLEKKMYSKSEIKNILKSQMPLKEKLKYADFIVDNNGSLKYLESQVEEIIYKI